VYDIARVDRALRRRAGLVFGALLASALGLGCDDSFDLPDAGRVDATLSDAEPAQADAGPSDLGEVIGPFPDASIGLSTGNLSPFSEQAGNGRYLLRGRLRSSDPRPSQSSRFKLRGGFVPLSR
jgi:hypothetical protein